MSQELAVVPFDKQMALANAFAESRMFGIASPQQALSLMALCECEGIHPAAAIRDYHIIDGKPSLKAEAMLTRFQASGGKIQWITYTDDEVTAKFQHPQGGELTITWDMERAKQAGLGPGVTKNGQPNMWSKFPRSMLRSRVISEGIRMMAPGILSGMYAPEEVMDFDTRAPIVINPTPVPDTTDDLITAIGELAGLLDVDMSAAECLSKLTNGKYNNIEDVRTMPKAHRDKLEKKVGEEKAAATP